MTAPPMVGSVFAAIDTAFGLLALGAHPGRPGYGARNAVWHDLVVNARQHPCWVTAALGMALPALRRAAGRISRGQPPVDVDDIDAEIVAAFVAGLTTQIG